VADDSLVRLHAGRPLAIRRSRGYAPLPVRLPQPAGELLATGAELKAVLGLAAGDRAYLSPHIGDMENLETLAAFERTYAHLRRILRVEPSAIVCDAHPDYLSSQWAARTAQAQGLALYRVQHHRAHAASVLAEYGVAPEHRVTAVIYDGTGYGDDAAIWGGEVFVGTVHSLTRVRHLPYVDLPGGDAAARRPVHCALAYLWQAGLDWEGPLPAGERRLLARQWERRLNCFPTSSMGRLFDGVAGYLGICREARYEAQAAIEMEAIAAAWTEKGEAAPPFEGPPWDLRALWQALRTAREQPPCLAARFHRTIAEWTLSACREADEETVALSGGVWQNVLLLRQTQALLERAGFRVLTPRLIPPNDAGLALGQLVLAAGIRSTPLDTPAPPLPS
jgi:hydrogenase maturation protein HypF